MLEKKVYFCLFNILSIRFSKEVFNFVNITQHFSVCPKAESTFRISYRCCKPPMFPCTSFIVIFFKMFGFSEIDSTLRFIPLEPSITKSLHKTIVGTLAAASTQH